eukprot:751257-Hanusia_phi.AAC.1
MLRRSKDQEYNQDIMYKTLSRSAAALAISSVIYVAQQTCQNRSESWPWRDKIMSQRVEGLCTRKLQLHSPVSPPQQIAGRR